MKTFVLSMILLLGSISLAAAPQCYNNAGVDPEVPFMLTLVNVNEYQLLLIEEDLTEGDLLNINNTFEFGTTYILALSVNAHHVDNGHTDVNNAVYSRVKSIAKKYQLSKSQFALECNGTVEGQPRAGGAN